jgi:hypothetical protein
MQRRTTIVPCTAIALLVASGSLHAATVEFRIIERRGQTSWTVVNPSSVLNDNILNLAVQARVVGGAPGEALGNFRFDMIMPGELESFGTLSKARISVGGTANYDVSAAQYNNNATVGVGGLAASFTYLAGISAEFNGLINTSSGFWTNTPDQDIGKVNGSPAGGAGLLAYGAAGRQDGNGNFVPDTWVSGTTAALDTAVAQQFLGANGNYVDVYHFNYTISNSALRAMTFTLNGVTAQTFTSLASVNDVWGPANPLDANVSVTNLTLALVPAPGAAFGTGMLILAASRRRRS